jgi:hypothetical protein
MDLISRTTFTASNVQVVNISLPQTYTDIMILASVRHTANGQEMYITLNGSGGSGTSLHSTQLEGQTTTTPRSFTINNAAAIWQVLYQGSEKVANAYGSVQVYIPSYTLATPKSILTESVSESNNGSVVQKFISSALNTSAALTSIQFITGNGFFEQHSTISVYGIKRQ